MNDYMHRNILDGWAGGISGPEALLPSAAAAFNASQDVGDLHMVYRPMTFMDSSDVAFNMTYVIDKGADPAVNVKRAEEAEARLAERAAHAAFIYNLGVHAYQKLQLINRRNEISQLFDAIGKCTLDDPSINVTELYKRLEALDDVTLEAMWALNSEHRAQHHIGPLPLPNKLSELTSFVDVLCIQSKED